MVFTQEHCPTGGRSAQPANYFAFPVARAVNAARLGNVQVVSSEAGVVRPPSDLQRSLRIGKATLREIQQACSGDTTQDEVAESFTFIDCTGFRSGGKLRLSNSDGAHHVGILSQIYGLAQYCAATIFKRGVDCHSGYFDHPETLRIIFGCGAVGLLGLRDLFQDQFPEGVEEHVKELGIRVCPGSSLWRTDKETWCM